MAKGAMCGKRGACIVKGGGECVVKRGMHGKRGVRVGDTVTEAGGTHPTGILVSIKFKLFQGHKLSFPSPK